MATLLGIDIVTITGVRAATHALESGEMVRLGDNVSSSSQLGLPFSVFFPVSRFESPKHGLFMPMRTGKDDTYTSSRDILEASFAPGSFAPLAEHAARTAALLKDPNSLPEDDVLALAFAHAMADRFAAEGAVPDSIMSAAQKHTTDVQRAFVPWEYLAAKTSLPEVYEYFERHTGEHQSTTVDCAHSIFASLTNGPSILRAVAENPAQKTHDLFVQLGAVESVLRMTAADSTLNGMLPEARPVYAKKTVIILNIREAAKESKDLAWAFGGGTLNRRCAAEGEILTFVRLVQDKLIELRSTQ